MLLGYSTQHAGDVDWFLHMKTNHIGSLPELCIFPAFICITFHLHYICISFAFRIAPRISIVALHFIRI